MHTMCLCVHFNAFFMPNIVIFASGSGSNAEAITRYLHEEVPHLGGRVACIIANVQDAYVLERAHRLGVPALYRPNSFMRSESEVMPLIAEYQPDLIVLAGYLALVPPFLINAYPGRIINIHPALLPKYGGKGMYGMNVHRAVKAADEPESGITIHLVDELFDHGTILAQYKTTLAPDDTPDDIAHRIHELEQRYFPRFVAEYLQRITSQS